MPWAHLDIASVMTTPKGGPYLEAGPSGKGARLLIKFLESLK
jgi:leucyl aminopeptidase